MQLGAALIYRRLVEYERSSSSSVKANKRDNLMSSAWPFVATYPSLKCPSASAEWRGEGGEGRCQDCDGKQRGGKGTEGTSAALVLV